MATFFLSLKQVTSSLVTTGKSPLRSVIFFFRFSLSASYGATLFHAFCLFLLPGQWKKTEFHPTKSNSWLFSSLRKKRNKENLSLRLQKGLILPFLNSDWGFHLTRKEVHRLIPPPLGPFWLFLIPKLRQIKGATSSPFNFPFEFPNDPCFDSFMWVAARKRETNNRNSEPQTSSW